MRKYGAFVLVAMLAACGGGGGGPVPVTGPTNAPPPPPPPTSAPVDSSKLISAEEDFVNGDSSWYTSGSASWSNHAGNPAGGPAGSSVDGATCSNVREGSTYPPGDFSQHVFVGIYYNGTEEALPQAVGLVNPQSPETAAPPDYPAGHPSNNYPVELAQCNYNVHTHDYSGLVHIEDTSVAQSNTTMPAYANLQTLFDVWGAHFTANGITAGSNALSGRAIVYVGTPSGTSGSNDLITSYTLYSGSLSSLTFTKHMAIWIVIGSIPSPGLPEVQIVQTN